MKIKTLTKITGWVAALTILSAISIIAIVQTVQAEDTVSIYQIAGGHYFDGGYDGGMMSHMYDYVYDYDIDEVDEFFYMMNDMAPLSYFVIGLIVLLLAGLALLSVLFILFFFLLSIFLIVKAIQSAGRGDASSSHWDQPETSKTSKVSKTSKKDEESSTKVWEGDSIGIYVYYLYFISIAFPILALPGVIIAYMYRNKSSEWMKSHYAFQIRTFWIGILYGIISTVFLVVLVGFLGYLFIIVWIIIRSVQGIRYHHNSLPVPKPTTWLWN